MGITENSVLAQASPPLLLVLHHGIGGSDGGLANASLVLETSSGWVWGWGPLPAAASSACMHRGCEQPGAVCSRQAWWDALLAQAQANRDQAQANRDVAAALLGAAPGPCLPGDSPSDPLEAWYAAGDASCTLQVAESLVEGAAKGISDVAGCHFIASYRDVDIGADVADSEPELLHPGPSSTQAEAVTAAGEATAGGTGAQCLAPHWPPSECEEDEPPSQLDTPLRATLGQEPGGVDQVGFCTPPPRAVAELVWSVEKEVMPTFPLGPAWADGVGCKHDVPRNWQGQERLKEQLQEEQIQERFVPRLDAEASACRSQEPIELNPCRKLKPDAGDHEASKHESGKQNVPRNGKEGGVDAAQGLDSSRTGAAGGPLAAGLAKAGKIGAGLLGRPPESGSLPRPPEPEEEWIEGVADGMAGAFGGPPAADFAEAKIGAGLLGRPPEQPPLEEPTLEAVACSREREVSTDSQGTARVPGSLPRPPERELAMLKAAAMDSLSLKIWGCALNDLPPEAWCAIVQLVDSQAFEDELAR